jgi:hypothetical protein
MTSGVHWKGLALAAHQVRGDDFGGVAPNIIV